MSVTACGRCAWRCSASRRSRARVTVAPEPQPSTWMLVLKPFDEITRGLPPPPPRGSLSPPALSPSLCRRSRPAVHAAGRARAGRGGFQRAGVTASTPRRRRRPPGRRPRPRRGAAPRRQVRARPTDFSSTAASTTARPRRSRRRRRSATTGGAAGSLFNGGLAFVLGNSAFDSQPVHVRRRCRRRKPDYSDVRVIGTFGGPLRFSKALRNGPTLFVAVQHADDHNADDAARRDADAARARRRLLAELRRVRPAAADCRSDDGAAVSRRRDSAVRASARRRPRCSATIRGRTSSTGTGFNFQAPLITAREQDLHHDARDAVDQQSQSADRHVRVSAHAHRPDDALRVRRHERRVRRRHVGDLDAPLQPVPLDASARTSSRS